jgi:hypothetical protein
VTEALFEALAGPPRPVAALPVPAAEADEDDLHLALYCCYELHYRGFAEVDSAWEWEPSLLGVRRLLEQAFESDLRAAVECVDVGPEQVVPELRRLAVVPQGPSLSAWVADVADLHHVRELAKHRSAYQLKEADPHTWGIPRLTGRAKSVMVLIQADEYGSGDEGAMHASLFADTMSVLGLDATPNRYLGELPGCTLATTNLISLLGLHRRWRGALVGHLAMFEMTSVGPMGRYARGLRRLGVPEAACRFYDVHVEADRVHQELAADGMVAGLMSREPGLARQVLFGATALGAVEARFAGRILDRWSAGRSSLYDPGVAGGAAKGLVTAGSPPR